MFYLTSCLRYIKIHTDCALDKWYPETRTILYVLVVLNNCFQW